MKNNSLVLGFILILVKFEYEVWIAVPCPTPCLNSVFPLSTFKLVNQILASYLTAPEAENLLIKYSFYVSFAMTASKSFLMSQSIQSPLMIAGKL